METNNPKIQDSNSYAQVAQALILTAFYGIFFFLKET